MGVDEFVGDVERAAREVRFLPALTYARPAVSDAKGSLTAEVIYGDVEVEIFGGKKDWEWNQRLIWR
jgi:hypothetical protein